MRRLIGGALALVLVLPVAPAVAGTANHDERDDQVVCRSGDASVGTRMSRRVCRTRAQWRALEEDRRHGARNMVDRLQDRPGGTYDPGGGPGGQGGGTQTGGPN
jgi:hypothetical protein